MLVRDYMKTKLLIVEMKIELEGLKKQKVKGEFLFQPTEDKNGRKRRKVVSVNKKEHQH